MSHCESCGKLKRGLCRYCQPQEYIDMMQQALMDLAKEPLLKREWRWLTDEEIYDAFDTIIEEPEQAIQFCYNIQAKLKELNT